MLQVIFNAIRSISTENQVFQKVRKNEMTKNH